MHDDIRNTHTQYVHMHIGVYILYLVTCAFASLFVVHLGAYLFFYVSAVYVFTIDVYIYIGIYTWIENSLNKELKKYL